MSAAAGPSGGQNRNPGFNNQPHNRMIMQPVMSMNSMPPQGDMGMMGWDMGPMNMGGMPGGAMNNMGSVRMNGMAVNNMTGMSGMSGMNGMQMGMGQRGMGFGGFDGGQMQGGMNWVGVPEEQFVGAPGGMWDPSMGEPMMGMNGMAGNIPMGGMMNQGMNPNMGMNMGMGMGQWGGDGFDGPY